MIQCITPAVSTVGNMLPSTTQSTRNTNPYLLRAIFALPVQMDPVPAPPFDLCVARADISRCHWNPQNQPSPQPVAVAANFVPSSIVVPSDDMYYHIVGPSS